MIDFLKISSLAIFDEIELEFGPGLNCITGETGAGKSLILGALTLLLGAKASRDLVRPGREKTSIEALFRVSGEEMVLRREIFPSGSNRCYIDGKLATVANLAEVSSDLIHIYGQHEYQDLLNPAQHMAILEDLAGLDRSEIHAAHDALCAAHKQLHDLETKLRQYQLDKDDLVFSLNELRSIAISQGLEDELSAELSLAYSAAELKRSAHLAEDILYSGNTSVVDLLAQVREHLSKITSIDQRLFDFSQSLENIVAQIEDISLGLRERIETYEYDPEKIETLEGNLHALQDLKRKYKTDESGLLALKDDLAKRIAITEDSSSALQEASSALELAQETYERLLSQYLRNRTSFADTFCSRINTTLKDLGMPGTCFDVQQSDPDHIGDLIVDARGEIAPANSLLKGEFFISTNVGQNPLPLCRTASGGELSRIMLAIKVQQKTTQDATLVFDEIDSGISGQTAFMIAHRLKELSNNAQSIVVTHLHQVASLADTHFVITKNVVDANTVSTVHSVHEMDRVMELARMMGGETPSSTVIEHAKELVKNHENLAQTYP